ncbi:MAG TPA: hypothetical protein VN175_15305 [Rhizomicrobium sp.]|nr:hypothetical protein [Rhizomicrobium sp.]
MVQNRREMLSGRRRTRFKIGTASLAVMAGLLAASPSFAQEPPVTLAQAGGTPQAAGSASQTAPTPERSPSQVTSFVGSLIPGFDFTAGVNLSESYETNAGGYSGNVNQDDWITQAGINLGMHEHSRRVSLDATYYGQVYYYSGNTQSTQFTNDLQALANVSAIPDYVNIIGRAFAQPVVISNSGFVSANGIAGPNSYRNSYGYSIGPDITFRLGDFARSDLLATYGGAYFTNPNGVNSAIVIPGVSGPQDVVMRSVNWTLQSGPDFSRLQWTGIGSFSETARSQGLLSQKTGIATFQYAITREFALLATGGYDAVSNTTPLFRDISGPVGMGGIAVTLEDFSFQFQVGQKYNSMSYQGALRWDIAPSAVLTGIVTDGISTPEGQLLGNLSGLTASLNGTLTTAGNIYANGSPSSLAAFSAQSLGSLSFNQNIARYQRISLGYTQDFERNHANLTLFGDKVTQLNGSFIGSPETNSWGGQASFSRDISRLTTGTLGTGYTTYQELGGQSHSFNVSGEVDYSLGPETRIYLRTIYLNRTSSQSLQTLSPFTGSLDDVRVTLGLTHQL